jgi:cytochrome c-type biogenesis protein CcmH/NrfG
MAVNVKLSVAPAAPLPYAPSEEWIARISQLQDALAVCPADISARSDLATLLEQLGQPEEALWHWNGVLVCDPNSLKAREGVARCRQRSGRPLSPFCERDHAHDLGVP